jgi:hypothetical protein
MSPYVKDHEKDSIDNRHLGGGEIDIHRPIFAFSHLPDLIEIFLTKVEVLKFVWIVQDNEETRFHPIVVAVL